jgi:hypothetical protein
MLFTVSVTNIEMNDKNGMMNYFDLKDNIFYREELEFVSQHVFV